MQVSGLDGWMAQTCGSVRSRRCDKEDRMPDCGEEPRETSLLIDAIARSVHNLPVPMPHPPCVEHGTSFVEVPSVLDSYPLSFGSDDCDIAVDSGEDVD